jgi:hypothetical protein
LVSDDIVESRHIPEGRLRNFDPGDVWLIEVTSYPPVGLQDHHGVILHAAGRLRKNLQTGGNMRAHVTDRGEILDENETEQRERFTNQPLMRSLVWDFKVVKVLITDGPERHRQLMRSHEQAKKDAEEEKQKQAEGQESLANAITNLTTHLASGTNEEGKEMSPDEALKLVMENFSADQLAQMAKEKKKK